MADDFESAMPQQTVITPTEYSTMTPTVPGVVYLAESCVGRGAGAYVYRCSVTPTPHDAPSTPLSADGDGSAVAGGDDTAAALPENCPPEVALKVINLLAMDIDEGDYEALLREVEIMRALEGHDHIVRLVDSFVNEEGALCIAMEYCSGDLAKLLEKAKARGRPMAEKTIWKLFKGLASGLRYMHSKRIMHRDLKPANVLLKGNKVKIADLGLGRILSASESGANTFNGTPYYLSPERLFSSSYSLPADIWSLGCVVYELAMFRSPFAAKEKEKGKYDSPMDFMDRLKAMDYEPLPDTYSEELRSLVDDMLAVDPDARPDIDAVYERLREAIRNLD